MRLPPLIIVSGLLLVSVALLGASEVRTTSEWLNVPAQSLEILPGSALDFSALVERAPAGSHGPLQLDSKGSLRFADGSMPPRFLCGMLASGPQQEARYPTHVEADKISRQLRMHGYSLVRLHNIDYILTRRAITPMAIDPEQLDRFRYLLAALRREGIYWMLDIFSRPTQRMDAMGWVAPMSPDDMRVRMHFDPVAKRQWLAFVDSVFATTNRYTGMSPLADPALAFVVGANENGIAFSSRKAQPYPTGFDKVFDRFVSSRFPTAAARAPLQDLSAAEIDGSMAVQLPAHWDEPSQRGSILDAFVATLEIDLYRWMRRELAMRGYRGPLLSSAEWTSTASNRTRAELPIIDTHAYVSELRQQANSTSLDMPSLLSRKGLGQITANFGTRWLDRPMIASEYGATYPNPFRYQGGAIFPALAAFQGWTTLCRMAFQSVELTIPHADTPVFPLRGYAVGLDPNERAQETLAALLFARGDVRRSNHVIAVPFGNKQWRNRGSAFLPAGIRDGVFLGRFGLIPPKKVDGLGNDAHIVMLESASANSIEFRANRLLVKPDLNTRAQQAALIAQFRAHGKFSRGNRSNSATGILHSDTDELLLDQTNRQMIIATSLTEAFTAEAPAQNIPLGTLTLDAVDRGALVAGSAIDGRRLEASRSILFILTGDVRNTRFRNRSYASDATPVGDWGHLPLQMERVRAKLSLSARPGIAMLQTLALDGHVLRRALVPRNASGRWEIRLDTASVLGQPTTFFLLSLPASPGARSSRSR